MKIFISRFKEILIFGILILIICSGCGTKTGQVAELQPTQIPTEVIPEIVQEESVSQWVKYYNEGQENSSRDIITIADSGFLIVGGIGQFQQSDTIGGIMVLRTAVNGNLLWQEVYGGEGYDYGSAVLETQDMGYIIAGETTSFGIEGISGYVIKVDESGQLIWSKIFDGEFNEVFNSILPSFDDSYYLIGNIVDPNDIITDPGQPGYTGFAGRSNIHIVKLDQDGNQEWAQTFESELNMIASEGILSTEGNIYILASVIKYPEKDGDLILLKYNQNGEQIWTRTWEDGSLAGYALAQDLEGNIIITGMSTPEDNSTPDVFLLKVDPNGNEMWYTTHGTTHSYEMGIDIVVTSNGNYAILYAAFPDWYSQKSSYTILFMSPDASIIKGLNIELGISVKTASLHNHPLGGLLITGGENSPIGISRTFLMWIADDGSKN